MRHNPKLMWHTRQVPSASDVLAPDGSEIRLLVEVPAASMVHCTLRSGQVTRAVQHRTVDELCYCVAGSGQLWRRAEGRQEIVDLQPGLALSIGAGVAFQFRANGPQPLELVITTLPPWPGEAEAVPTDGVWLASL